jgi:hypothetical protein
LIALQYHEVRVNFEFRAASELYCGTGLFLSNAPTLSLSDASLLVDYVYLDSEERRRFAQVGHEYLIEQVQFTGEEGINSSTVKPKLSFNHPTKELVWVARHGDQISGQKYLAYTHLDDWTATVQAAADNLALGMLKLDADAALPTLVAQSGSDGYTEDNTDHTTLTAEVDASAITPAVWDHDAAAGLSNGSVDLTEKISEIVMTVDENSVVTSISAVHTLTIRDVSRALNRYTTDNRNAWVKEHRDVKAYFHHNFAMNVDGTGNPLQKALLQLNGHDRVTQLGGGYFNHVQPYQHHSNTPREGINVYSFALDPEKHQPSGSANLSRIDTTVLNLWFHDATSTGNTTDDDNTTHSVADSDSSYSAVYACSYNVLRVMSGMGGVAYSN